MAFCKTFFIFPVFLLSLAVFCIKCQITILRNSIPVKPQNNACSAFFYSTISVKLSPHTSTHSP